MVNYVLSTKLVAQGLTLNNNIVHIMKVKVSSNFSHLHDYYVYLYIYRDNTDKLLNIEEHNSKYYTPKAFNQIESYLWDKSVEDLIKDYNQIYQWLLEDAGEEGEKDWLEITKGEDFTKYSEDNNNACSQWEDEVINQHLDWMDQAFSNLRW